MCVVQRGTGQRGRRKGKNMNDGSSSRADAEQERRERINREITELGLWDWQHARRAYEREQDAWDIYERWQQQQQRQRRQLER